MKNSVVFLTIVLVILFYQICISGTEEPQVDPGFGNSVGIAADSLPDVYLYEDFNDVFVLNWDIVNEDSQYWSLDKVPGTLTITTQEEAFERAVTDYHNVFLADFPVTQSRNFQLTTCISNFEPEGLWNQAGLLLWNDEDNYIKLSYEYGEGPPPNNAIKLLFTVEREIDGYPNFGWFEAEQEPLKTWLRIVKQGNFYEFYKSTDGETFVPMKVIQPARLVNDNTLARLDIPIKSIGIFANSGSRLGAPQVDASFEFVEFKLLPGDGKDTAPFREEDDMPENENEGFWFSVVSIL